MADSDHAPLAPSSLERLAMCPGSRELVLMFPQEETIESREGTAAHWALAQLLNGHAIAVGQVADNGVTLNDEMVECAEDTSDYIAHRDGINAHRRAPATTPFVDAPPDRLVETTLRNNVLHDENYGTPDLIEFNPVETFVDDYKHGHKYVEVVGNKQLINYALLYLNQLARNGVLIPPNYKITLTIHQPRCYHRASTHRSWSLTYAQLIGYVQPLRERLNMAMQPGAQVFATDPRVCEHCPARHACEGAAAAAYSAVEHGYSSVPLSMSNAAIGLELRTLERAQNQLKARISGLEEHAKRLMREPGGVPGWRVEHGTGRTVWDEDKAPISNIIYMAQATGVDISRPDILTPKQAAKAGMHPDIIAAFTKVRPGAAELVEDDGSLARRIFSGV